MGCFRACRSLRVPLCPSARTEACHCRSQGEHHVRSIPMLPRMQLMHVYRKMSDGMFLSACRQVAKEFPDISYDEDLLDRVCLQVRSFVAKRETSLIGRALDRAKPSAVLGSRDGHAQPLRRHPVGHVCWSDWWSRSDAVGQHWTCMCIV